MINSKKIIHKNIHTVNPELWKHQIELIKCRLDNFEWGLLDLNLRKCKNKYLVMKYAGPV